MVKNIFHQTLFRKMLIYTSAAVLFITVPALPASAAENTQQFPADTNTAQLSADTVTATPVSEPAPADQGGVAVTPMQTTVYAASKKGLNVRSGPSTSSSKLGTLKYGEAITVTGITADNWYQIQYGGNVGYVLADYVSDTPLTTQNTASDPPAAENPPAENPVTPDTDVSTPDNEAVSGEDTEAAAGEPQTDEDVFTGNPPVTSSLIGTPVILILGLAVVGVMSLIGYSVYSLFKKDEDYEDESYPDDDYYEDEDDEDGQYADSEVYEDEQYADSEDYEDQQYADNEVYKNEQYADDNYYENEQYPDDKYENRRHAGNKYYENRRYPDNGYYENGQYTDDEYYEDGQYSDDVYDDEQGFDTEFYGYPQGTQDFNDAYDNMYDENEQYPGKKRRKGSRKKR